MCKLYHSQFLGVFSAELDLLSILGWTSGDVGFPSLKLPNLEARRAPVPSAAIAVTEAEW